MTASSLKDALPGIQVYQLGLTRQTPLQAQPSFPALQILHVPAIDGRQADLEAVLEQCSARSIEVNLDAFRSREGCLPTPSQLACAVGHHIIYQRIADSGAPYALVLEEDALFVRPDSDFAHAAEVLVRPTPVIVQLSCRGQIFSRNRRVEAQVGPTSPFTLIPLRYPPRQTSAYLINAPAARLAAAKPIDGLADWPGFATWTDYWAVTPLPFAETLGATTIEVPSGPQLSRQGTGQRWRSRVKLRPELAYRSTLPLIEARLWRRRGMPRVAPDFEIWQPSLPSSLVNLVRRAARAGGPVGPEVSGAGLVSGLCPQATGLDAEFRTAPRKSMDPTSTRD
jgi:hypothetical protein